ncbi:hypothetical protein CEXT_397401 [Caerostris extrusa]|uniref:Uncharacterized protein n=1 Tax=Caerostris extrusa TaxID=172846 RepID=A0AAV4Q0U9_CAEEX|nr:hypothetical protein CEXT_397401 [Caerostris extrusa]
MVSSPTYRIQKIIRRKINKADSEISKLNENQNKIEESTALLKHKVERSEKEANQWEEKNKDLTEAIKISQMKIDGFKEKRFQEIEKFEKEAVNLCELFGSTSAMNDGESIQAETHKLYQQIEQIHLEHEEINSELDKSRSELDDLVLYQVPYNQKEVEIPLGQRKLTLKLFEDALEKAKAQIEHLNQLKLQKEEELEKLISV